MYSSNRSSHIFFFLLLSTCGIKFVTGLSERHVVERDCQQPFGCAQYGDQKPLNPNPHTIPELLNALDVLQDEFFEVWQGVWPRAIDWTSAVLGTYLAAALATLSKSFESLSSHKVGENLINKYFSQLVASYFGQDAFALRQQAYDDMLWVVLGWLEGIKFINEHSANHYSNSTNLDGSWYGTQWIPAFAHRSRLFWEMASQGWNTTLCNGGMIWSPYLTPYKNAITNELYIAASIAMYIYFPGDSNSSPFMSSDRAADSSVNDILEPQSDALPHDPKYLAAAIGAYKWLIESNMTDSKGLYVDGFHISGWSPSHDKNLSNTQCDARNEMVYTYNQGVLLTGQRGLYEATGVKAYLEDGHQLISNVIAATGWDLREDAPVYSKFENALDKWRGLGRSGILEEFCDANGSCSQDSQTFKGIFMHHFTTFCQRLPDHLVLPGLMYAATDQGDVEEVRNWHDGECKKYKTWIRHNAEAALTTRDGRGRFGAWWGAPARTEDTSDIGEEIPHDSVDYRNQGIPKDWTLDGINTLDKDMGSKASVNGIGAKDLNDRGRGRRAETQGGGVSILRALWELVDTR